MISGSRTGGSAGGLRGPQRTKLRRWQPRANDRQLRARVRRFNTPAILAVRGQTRHLDPASFTSDLPPVSALSSKADSSRTSRMSEKCQNRKWHIQVTQRKSRPKATSQESMLDANRIWQGRLRRPYFSEVLIELNMVFKLLPRPLTAARIAIEMPAAIRPYSIAVAPDSSDKKFQKAILQNQPPGLEWENSNPVKLPARF